MKFKKFGNQKFFIFLMVTIYFGSAFLAYPQGEKNVVEVLTESLKEVKFFESSYNLLGFKKRVYRTYFIQSLTR